MARSSQTSEGRSKRLDLGLLAEDRGAGLELGGLDLDAHAPVEAGAEPLLQPLQVLRRPIAGQDDLDVPVVEVVEGVEELLGGLLLAGQELDVVDQERGALAVLAPELLHGAGPLGKSADELVGVALRRDDGDAPARALAQDGVCDGVEQVGLAEAGGAVQEERVPGVAGLLCDRLGGGEGELVGAADDEGLEEVAGARARVAGIAGGGGRRDRALEGAVRRLGREAGRGGGARGVIDGEGDPDGPPGEGREELLEPGAIVVLDEVAVELVGRGDPQPVALEG